MAIAIQSQAALANIQNLTTMTLNIAPGGGSRRKLLVSVSGEQIKPAPAVSSVTYNSVGLTLFPAAGVNTPTTGAQNFRYWYYLDEANFPGAAADIVVTFAANVSIALGYVYFLSDAASGAPSVGVTGGATNTSSQNINITPLVANGLAIAGSSTGHDGEYNAVTPPNVLDSAVVIPDPPGNSAQFQHRFHTTTAQITFTSGMNKSQFRYLMSALDVAEDTGGAPPAVTVGTRLTTGLLSSGKHEVLIG